MFIATANYKDQIPEALKDRLEIIEIKGYTELEKLDIAKKLLCAFAETYNLEFNSDLTIKQYYQSPSVLSNFNEIGYGYRSLLTMRGTLQISENSNLIKSISLVGGTDLAPTLTFAFDGLKGPKGDKGDQGPQGPTGPQGPAGADGTMTFMELTDEQKASNG